MLIPNHIKEDFEKQVKKKNDIRLMRESKASRQFLFWE